MARKNKSAGTTEAPDAPDASDETTESAAPDRNELVSVFNKNPPGGDFVHHLYEDVTNGDGAVVKKRVKTEYRLAGRSFGHVPRWVAELWMKQAPHQVISGEEASKGAPVAPAQTERVAALEGENADLKKRLANLEKLTENLRADPTGEAKD